MTFQSVPETAEVVLTFSDNGETVVNVLAARFVGGYNLALVTSLAAAVDAAVVANYMPRQVNGVSYVSTTVRGLEFENDVEAVNNAGAGVGGLIETGVTNNVTFAVKKLSGLTGRSARGRLFFIGMPRSALQANLNLIDAASVTLFVAAIEGIRTAIVVDGWSPVIVSRFANKLKRAVGVTFFWATTVANDDEVDSQRGRLANS